MCKPADAIQTVLDRRNPSRPFLANHRAMACASALVASPKSSNSSRDLTVLELGFGGGSLYRYLCSLFPGVTYTGVEASGAMIDTARQYFGLSSTNCVRLQTAERYLSEHCPETDGDFDLILCDLFDGRESPAATSQEWFFRSLAERLSDRGMAAINLLPVNSDDVVSVLRAARSSFPGFGLLQFQDLGNLVVFLSAEPLPMGPELNSLLKSSPFAQQSEAQSFFQRLYRPPT